MVSGDTRRRSATSRIVIRSGRSSSDTFAFLLSESDMVCSIYNQILLVKHNTIGRLTTNGYFDFSLIYYMYILELTV